MAEDVLKPTAALTYEGKGELRLVTTASSAK